MPPNPFRTLLSSSGRYLPSAPPRSVVRTLAVSAAVASATSACLFAAPATVFADAPISGLPDSPAASTGVASGKKGGKVFLDADGKPCAACTSFNDWMKTGAKKGKKSSVAESSASSSSDKASSGTTVASSGAAGGLATLGLRSEEELKEMRKDCPPDIEELGRATWILLHTLASSLPSNPPPATQAHLTAFLSSLTHLYPCPHCRADFERSVELAGGEPGIREAVKTRAGVEKWVCERHDEVNRKLGKEEFGCGDVAAIRKRWKDGGERCSFW